MGREHLTVMAIWGGVAGCVFFLLGLTMPAIDVCGHHPAALVVVVLGRVRGMTEVGRAEQR